MTLGDVAEVVGVEASTFVHLVAPTPVTAIAYDSRSVRPAAVFVALRGQKADGASFAAQAIARGAITVIAETPSPATVTVPWMQVRDARLSLALLADRFFGSPSRRMPVVGVTGGVMGTVSYRVGRVEREASRTTPEAPDVQQLLAEMLEQGCRSAVMEVSSHALALKRVDGMRFAAAVFTNLTRDHLDFHEDMEQYFAAKRRLFQMLEPGVAGVVNADDPRATSLLAVCPRAITYGITQIAHVTPGPFALDIGGLTLDVRTPKGSVAVRSSLVGRPNVYNILAATATAVALDLPLEAVSRGVHALSGVPGRFEVVSDTGDDVTVVVDYAHTDDALRNLLETARPLAPQRLVTVFGCGGDRDTTKRPLMGMVAARLSDVVIVTSDNPRSEDPRWILDDIRRGITPASHAGRHVAVMSIVDRGEAIDHAVSQARSGDLVLVAGKGHEKYQQIGDRVLPFDDVAVARAALGRRRAKQTRAV